LGLYLKHGHYGPQEGVEVFTVATGRLVAGFATKFASEQIHAQNTVADLLPPEWRRKENSRKDKHKQKKRKRKKKKTLNIYINSIRIDSTSNIVRV
jgi:hypothetical protein